MQQLHKHIFSHMKKIIRYALDNISLICITIILAIIQVSINNLNLFYLDLIAILLSIMLFFNFTQSIVTKIIAVSIFADLFSCFFLGTHLFATIMLSFFSHRMIKFYNILTNNQKIFFIAIFYCLIIGILCLVQFINNKPICIDFFGLVVAVIIVPFIVSYFNRYILSSFLNQQQEFTNAE